MCRRVGRRIFFSVRNIIYIKKNNEMKPVRILEVVMRNLAWRVAADFDVAATFFALSLSSKRLRSLFRREAATIPPVIRGLAVATDAKELFLRWASREISRFLPEAKLLDVSQETLRVVEYSIPSSFNRYQLDSAEMPTPEHLALLRVLARGDAVASRHAIGDVVILMYRKMLEKEYIGVWRLGKG
jgi:hypothetical protein